MSDRQDLRMIRNLNREGKRWETTPQIRSDALQLVEDVIGDENKATGLRLKAADLLLRMEASNQLDERMELEVGARNVGGPMMVLLLPENGSEATSPLEGASGEQEGDVLDSIHCAEASVEAERTS